MKTKAQKYITVTGVNGFVGKHLVRELHQNGAAIIGVGREPKADSEIKDLLSSYVVADLAQQWPETEAVDAVIHLAGLAAVGPSFEHPQDYLNLNSAMVTNMAEHYLHQASKPRLIVVSSGAVYGADQPMPLTESSAIDFNSPYTVSKVLVENQCAYYRKRGLDCVIARPFNHFGPGQMEGFLVPDVIAQLKQGDKITVGNITTKRDYTDVRDVARAYRLLATIPNLYHQIYNVCSGTSRSGEEIVAAIRTAMSKPEAEVIVDQSKVRPTDAPDIYGDAGALKADAGWFPEIPLETTIKDCAKAVIET